MVPPHRFPQNEPGKDDENDQRNDLLLDLQPIRVEHLKSDPIGGNLEEVFEKSDAPGDEDDEPERLGVEILEMAVPIAGHERV